MYNPSGMRRDPWWRNSIWIYIHSNNTSATPMQHIHIGQVVVYAKRSQDNFGSRTGFKKLDFMIFNFEV
jgi:hypothetical protein